MARTDNRLDLDANLVGYWGFDEALETDNAIDESQYADAHLTVFSSPSVQIGRVGSSRTFSSGAYATSSNSRLRITGDLSLMVWFKFGSINGTGSTLRCVASCSGPTTSDAQNYGLYVDDSGRIVYKHSSASGEVVVKSAAGIIKVGQFYHVVITRMSNTVLLYVDNFLLPTPVVTVNGVSSSFPVPAPVANASATFNVGRSLKESDSAPWDGQIDELSVHDTARIYQPYIRGVYFRAALRSGTTKLVGSSSVKSIASSDMGAGVRWWCYERDKDLFVVKESPFGRFQTETRLTTPGGALFTGTQHPELIYDAASDTLLVLFVAGNRIYKLTATSTDDPATINMPFTADTGGIIKSVDNVDAGRMGSGFSGQREVLESDMVYVNRTPLKMNVIDSGGSMGSGFQSSDVYQHIPGPNLTLGVAFNELPSPYGFGLVVGPKNSQIGGYIAYAEFGGAATVLGYPTLVPDGTNRYFIPISSRPYACKYYVQALSPSGEELDLFSDILLDLYNEVITIGSTGTSLLLGQANSAWDWGSLASGFGGQREFLESDMTYVNRTPIKLSSQDSGDSLGSGSGGGQSGTVTQASQLVML